MRNNIIRTAILALAAGLLAVSCSKEEEQAAPVVTLTEVGLENTHRVAAGGDLHLEADIVAAGGIKSITVSLRPESGGGNGVEVAYTAGPYIGVRNTEFHEHIEIPADTPEGNHSLRFTVEDNNGRRTTATARVEIGGQA